MMATKSNTIKKAAILEALESSLGVVTTACKEVGINPSTYYDWLKKDEQFRTQVEAIENVALDFATTHLYKQIKEGNVAAIIFFLKTKGKRRGFVEKQQAEHSGSIPVIKWVE
jgi:hypothetical protein